MSMPSVQDIYEGNIATCFSNQDKGTTPVLYDKGQCWGRLHGANNEPVTSLNNGSLLIINQLMSMMVGCSINITVDREIFTVKNFSPVA